MYAPSYSLWLDKMTVAPASAAALAICRCEAMYSSHRAAFVPNAPVNVPPEYATVTGGPVVHRKDVRQRSRSVPRRRDDLHCGVAERQLVPSGPTTMSRVGTPPAAVGGRCSVDSQSVAPITTFAPNRFCSSAAP